MGSRLRAGRGTTGTPQREGPCMGFVDVCVAVPSEARQWEQSYLNQESR